MKSDLRIIALPLLLCVLLSACGVGLGDPDVLREKPEATLAPPGAEFRSDGGTDAGHGIEGRTDAEWRTSFSVDLNPMEIRDWYAGELGAADGWRAHQSYSGSLPSTEWCQEGADYHLYLQFRELDFDPPTRYTWSVRPSSPDHLCFDQALHSFGPEE